jgi:hypothetical protein
MTDKRKGIPQNVRFNVLRRDNFTCRYCGRSSPEVVLHLDHAKPFSAGGECSEENLITACETCNLGKGAAIGVEPPVLTPSEGAQGFAGFFGHTFQDAACREFQYQFRFIRQVAPGRYAVQLFSWAFGDPTDIQIWTVEQLSAPTVRLYASADIWRDAYTAASRYREDRE